MTLPPNKSIDFTPKIERVFLERYDMTFDDFSVRCRKREIVFARQMIHYFLKKYTTHSLKAIGAMFAGLDHTTIIYSIKTIKDLTTQQPEMQEIAYMDICIKQAINENVYNIIKSPIAKPRVITQRGKYVMRKKRRLATKTPVMIPDKKVIPISRPPAEYSNNGHINLVKKYT